MNIFRSKRPFCIFVDDEPQKISDFKNELRKRKWDVFLLEFGADADMNLSYADIAITFFQKGLDVIPDVIILDMRIPQPTRIPHGHDIEAEAGLYVFSQIMAINRAQTKASLGSKLIPVAVLSQYPRHTYEARINSIVKENCPESPFRLFSKDVGAPAFAKAMIEWVQSL